MSNDEPSVLQLSTLVGGVQLTVTRPSQEAHPPSSTAYSPTLASVTVILHSRAQGTRKAKPHGTPIGPMMDQPWG